MQFSTKTENELDTEFLIPAGTTCDFEVVEAAEKVSAKGNDMIALQLKVWHADRDYRVRDWLLSSMGHKLLHFCEATGLTPQYAAGTLTKTDCLGKTGKLVVSLEEGKNGYAAQNKVDDYIGHRKASSPPALGAKPAPTPPTVLKAPKPAAANTLIDDDVPF